jgi:RNA polymerase sigma factor (sigma-70 family)
MTPLLSSALLRVQSDERLVQLAVQGHERAFEAIVDRYRRPLLRYLQRLLPGDRAEDVLQAAFVSAWTSLDRGAAVRDLRPWLYRICHNGALNALARRGYDHDELSEALHGAPSPLEQLERRHVVRQTLAALTELPDRQRDALLAVAVEGRPHAEVARELGLSDGALRQLVHRARCTVRSAATAVTPVPVLNWFLQLGTRGGAPRIAELLGGAGMAGAAKVAAVVVATGAVIVGGSHVTGHHAGAAQAAAAAPRVLRSGPGTRVAARQPVRRAAKAHGRHRTAHPRQSIARTGSLGRGSVVPPRVGTHREPPAPASKITVTHGDGVATGPEPTPSATTPAPTTTATTVSSAPEPAPEPAAPTPTEPPPAPAPEPCHEVACRPAPPPPPPPPPPPTEPLPKIHAIRA